jgi:hypothetical protein
MQKTRILILLEVGLVIAFILRYFKVLPNFEVITFMLVYICTVLNRDIYIRKSNLYFLILLVMILAFGIPKFDPVNLIPFISYGLIIISVNLFSRKKLFLRTLYAVALFFIISNFLFWMFEPWLMYPKSLMGLLLCYFNALPFWRNQIISNLSMSILFSLALKNNLFEIENESLKNMPGNKYN